MIQSLFFAIGIAAVVLGLAYAFITATIFILGTIEDLESHAKEIKELKQRIAALEQERKQP